MRIETWPDPQTNKIHLVDMLLLWDSQWSSWGAPAVFALLSNLVTYTHPQIATRRIKVAHRTRNVQ